MATPTPQLKPGASKFRTEEGATKVLDAFLHTLLAAVQVNDGKTNVIQGKQFAKSQVGKMMIEKMLPAKTFTICILQRLSPIQHYSGFGGEPPPLRSDDGREQPNPRIQN